MTRLRGITWNHTRGHLPMVATAQRFSEIHPDVEIVWEKRSLQEFADQPLGRLAGQFDLLVIDHPWIGHAVANRLLAPLDRYLPGAFLDDQAAHSVGASHFSYQDDGHQWALAIDASAPVAAFRPDLLERHGLNQPRTWEELLEFAASGLAIAPGDPVDTLMNFFMAVSASGEDPFLKPDAIVGVETGVAALRMLKSFADRLNVEIGEMNPIRVLETMADGDDYAYCPFIYGYSNYARTGYAKHRLVFADTVLHGNRHLKTTLGGAGLAISAACREIDIAAQYAAFVAAPLCQRTLYFDAGGQPGHRAAWIDDEINRRASDFFRNGLPCLERAFLRPRYDGFLNFQDRAGRPIRDYLRCGGDEVRLLEKLNAIYLDSRRRRS